MIESSRARCRSGSRSSQFTGRSARQFAEHYHGSPELVTEEALRQHFLYLKVFIFAARHVTRGAIRGDLETQCRNSTVAVPVASVRDDNITARCRQRFSLSIG